MAAAAAAAVDDNVFQAEPGAPFFPIEPVLFSVIQAELEASNGDGEALRQNRPGFNVRDRTLCSISIKLGAPFQTFFDWSYFHHACALHLNTAANGLLEHSGNALLSEVDSTGQTPILVACMGFCEKTGDACLLRHLLTEHEAVRATIDQHDHGVKSCDQLSVPPLHVAISYGNLNHVRTLVDFGARVDDTLIEYAREQELKSEKDFRRCISRNSLYTAARYLDSGFVRQCAKVTRLLLQTQAMQDGKKNQRKRLQAGESEDASVYKRAKQ